MKSPASYTHLANTQTQNPQTPIFKGKKTVRSKFATAKKAKTETDNNSAFATTPANSNNSFDKALLDTMTAQVRSNAKVQTIGAMYVHSPILLNRLIKIINCILSPSIDNAINQTLDKFETKIADLIHDVYVQKLFAVNTINLMLKDFKAFLVKQYNIDPANIQAKAFILGNDKTASFLDFTFRINNHHLYDYIAVVNQPMGKKTGVELVDIDLFLQGVQRFAKV